MITDPPVDSPDCLVEVVARRPGWLFTVSSLRPGVLALNSDGRRRCRRDAENPGPPARATCQRRGPPGGRWEKRRRHGAHGHQDRPGVPLGRSPQGPAVESKRQGDKRSRKCDGPALRSSQSVGGRVQPRMERTLPPPQAMSGRRRDHTPRQGDGNSAPRPFPILWRLALQPPLGRGNDTIS